MLERALIQCGDHWENQMRILPLALTLKERGFAPYVLTYAPDQGALFARHGVGVWPLDLGGRRPAHRYEWWDRGQALAAMLRGAADPVFAETFEIEARRDAKRFSTARKRRGRAKSILRHRHALEQIFEALSPGHVFIWNGLTGIVANLLRLMCRARAIPTSFLERGYLPGSVFIDPEGTNGDAGLAKRDHIPAAEASWPLPPTPPRPSLDGLRAQLGLPEGRLIFLPLQVQADTNILFHSDHFKTMRQLVLEVAAAMPADCSLVVRPHPEETNRKLDLPSGERLRVTTLAGVEEWCDLCALTVTINSTVGLTALARGRPVVQLGRSIYANKQLTCEPRPTELAAALARASTYEPPPATKVRDYLSYLLANHTVTAQGPNLGVPTSDGERACPAPSPSPRSGCLEVSVETAELVASRWTEMLRSAQQAARSQPVYVWAKLKRSDTCNRTYRLLREELTWEAVVSGVAALLGVPAEHVRVSKAPPASNALLVVLAPQRVEVTEAAALVLDQYLEPHLGWLRSSANPR